MLSIRCVYGSVLIFQLNARLCSINWWFKVKTSLTKDSTSNDNHTVANFIQLTQFVNNDWTSGLGKIIKAICSVHHMNWPNDPNAPKIIYLASLISLKYNKIILVSNLILLFLLYFHIQSTIIHAEKKMPSKIDMYQAIWKWWQIHNASIIFNFLNRIWYNITLSISGMLHKYWIEHLFSRWNFCAVCARVNMDIDTTKFNTT